MTILMVIALIPFFLCWGSFLNVVAYRLIRDVSFIRPRSYCIHCRHSLAWYDLLPVISWFMLKGRCRYCNEPITFLYPLIELLTALLMTLLVLLVPHSYQCAYFIFFSALIVTIRSDLETMLISRFVTLFLIPLGFAASACGLLDLTLFESILGACVGWMLLYLIDKFFFMLTKKNGLGQGDIDLLAFIGSFLGIYGCWVTLLLSSLIGSIIGGMYMFITGASKTLKIPYGPFLALGAIIFVLFKSYIFSFIF